MRRFIPLLGLTLALLTPLSFQAGALAPAWAATAVRPLEAQVLDNHDGDTLTVRLDGGRVEKVRLLGMDTAEIAQGVWGAKARDFTRELTRNRRVKLVFDVQQRDRYGRLLAYVYLPDGQFLNLALVRQGYAMLLTYPPNVAHADDLLKAQQAARSQGLNIWGRDGLTQSPRDFRHQGGQAAPERAPASARPDGHRVSLNTRSLKYHEPSCRAFECEHCQPMTEAEARARGATPCGLCH